MKVPEWTDFAKLGGFNEMSPNDPDWLFIRAGTILCSISIMKRKNRFSFFIIVIHRASSLVDRVTSVYTAWMGKLICSYCTQCSYDFSQCPTNNDGVKNGPAICRSLINRSSLTRRSLFFFLVIYCNCLFSLFSSSKE